MRYRDPDEFVEGGCKGCQVRTLPFNLCSPRLGDFVLDRTARQGLGLHQAIIHQPSDQVVIKEGRTRPRSACKPFKKLTL